MSYRLYQGPHASILVGPGRVLFTAPKALLVQHSKFFEKALGGSFKEATTSEILLPEYDPEAFKHILHYMFTGSLGYEFETKHGCYTNDWVFSNPEEEAPANKAKVYCWTLCRMSYHADTLLMEDLVEYVNYQLTSFFEDSTYYAAARSLYPLNVDLIMDVYENTTEGSSLRRVVLNEVKKLLGGEDGRYEVEPKDYEECLTTIPGFAADLVGTLSKRLHEAEIKLRNPPFPPYGRGSGRGRGRGGRASRG